MSRVTKTIFVKVLTFDPVGGRMIPVPNARLLCEAKGWLWDPDLSDGSHTTDTNGLAQVVVNYDEANEDNLNPFFTITIPAAHRTIAAIPVPSGSSPFTLPEQWQTRHYVNHRIPRISVHADATNPLELFVGLDCQLRLAYADFDSSGKRNPIALPQDTARVHLADYDEFLWIDWLDADDTMTGFGVNPTPAPGVAVPARDAYPYFDVYPTAPSALDQLPAPPPTAPRAWLDPPGMPVGTLGGGSFEQVGTVAVDSSGYVFLIDGNVVRRFYPDGTLCETIALPAPGFNNPAGLVVDQYRNLFVADTGNRRILLFQPDWTDGRLAGTKGRYRLRNIGGSTSFSPSVSGLTLFNQPMGMAVVSRRSVDEPDLLAVADAAGKQVHVFRIDLTTSGSNQANRATTGLNVALNLLASFGTASTTPPVDGQFSEPVAVAADREGRLFVCDRALHRISRWAFNSTSSYTHEATWGAAGGSSGNGAGEFNTPVALAVDSKSQYLYVAETGNQRVQRLDLNGSHLVHWQHSYADGTRFTPRSVAIDTRCEIYVTDAVNRRVLRGRVFNASGNPLPDATVPITDAAVVGTPWTAKTDPSHFNAPQSVYCDRDSKLWVSDTGNNRLLVYERNPAGVLVTATAPVATGMDRPVGVVRDVEGNLFVVNAGNHRVRKYDATLTFQTELGGGPGNAANQFNDPRGMAIAQRVEPMLYVADRGNNRIQILRRDGSFTGSISTVGSVTLNAPEDVAIDLRGNVYIADTGNGQIVCLDATHGFIRQFTLTAPGATGTVTRQPCGISVDSENKLIVTDRAQQIVFRVEPDGTLIAFWDLKNLLRQDVGSNSVYYPELARMLVFAAPSRAVVDAKGLLAVADTGHDRVRLIRSFSHLPMSLFDLGEGEPDISLRAYTRADWSADVQRQLKVNVGDLSIFDDAHNFIAEPIADFARDHYDRHQILSATNSTNAAINVLQVLRLAQRWLRHLTRTDESPHRWGDNPRAQKLDVDLTQERGALHPWDSDAIKLGRDLDSAGAVTTEGRTIEAWDDSVVVHEWAHWVFDRSTRPYPPFAQRGGDHRNHQIIHPNLAASEGFAEYHEMFWGSEFTSTNRLRGFPMAGGLSTNLTILATNPDDPSTERYLFGGVATATLPTFDTPGKGLENEGYFANTLWQVHQAIVSPDILFADSSNFWYFHNCFVSETESQRFVKLLRKALRLFPNHPTSAEFNQGTRLYLKQILAQAHLEFPDLAPVIQAIYELNNQLMPTIALSEGTSSTTAGTPVASEVPIPAGQTKSLIVRVADGSDRPLTGYNLQFQVGNAAAYAFPDASPSVQHGQRTPAAPPPTDLYRATNSNGIVRINYTAPAGAAGTIETLTVTYQPDFDTDASLAPPNKTDNWETTLRKNYLYELRTVAKTWAGTGNNFGAKVSVPVRFNVQPAT